MSQPQQIPGQPTNEQPPQNGTVYLIFSILATILCCLPLGIPAIVYAAQIDGKLRAGDIIGATQSAKLAKIWTIVAAASGLLFIILYVLFVFVFAGSMASAILNSQSQ